jgi:hypothetical protein
MCGRCEKSADTFSKFVHFFRRDSILPYAHKPQIFCEAKKHTNRVKFTARRFPRPHPHLAFFRNAKHEKAHNAEESFFDLLRKCEPLRFRKFIEQRHTIQD